MGRDKSGKRQEDQSYGIHTAQEQQDYTGRDKALGAYGANVDNLRRNPGYTPEDLQAANSENAQQIHSVYGSEANDVRRNSAETGYANDAGLYPQLSSITDARGRAEASGANNIALKQADAVLNTRRQLPSMYFAPAQLLSNSSNSLAGGQVGLVNQREQVDQTTPLWAQFAMTAMNNAGQVGAAAAGK